jgi:type VI secretion system secreted protein Hcp
MPIYLQISGIKGRFTGAVGGQVRGMSQGTKNITPSDLCRTASSFFLGGEKAYDVNVGKTPGKRQHGPIQITKETDSSTPGLFTAVSAHVVFPTIKLGLLKGNSKNSARPWLTIKLSDAAIAGYRRLAPAQRGRGPTNNSTVHLEEISLIFQKIEITNIFGGTSASDDWTTG